MSQDLQWHAGYPPWIRHALAHKLARFGERETRSCTLMPFELSRADGVLLVSILPEGPEWTYEIKLDDYRAQALSDGEQTRLLSRNGKDLGQRFPALIPEFAKAISPDSIVDDELVALDPSGRPSFSLIQSSATNGATFVFFAFDLLRL